MIKFITLAPRLTVLAMIRIYQKTLSMDHGPLRHLHPDGYCRFNPTCSEYGYQSIERFGILHGGVKTAWRIIRCNPWNPGGNDPVENSESETHHKH